MSFGLQMFTCLPYLMDSSLCGLLEAQVHLNGDISSFWFRHILILSAKVVTETRYVHCGNYWRTIQTKQSRVLTLVEFIGSPQ